METILVSACCAGFPCRYNNLPIEKPVFPVPCSGAFQIIPVCPELLGSMGVSRPRADFRKGDGTAVLNGKARIVNENHVDVTEYFITGAKRALRLCRRFGIKKSFLADRSPSCGSSQVYINNQLKKGMGVFSALLHQNGIKVLPVGH